MNEILKTTILGLFFGTFGTTLGGIIGVIIKKNSNKFLSFILAFASGLMMSIICFDLIPEALGISSIINVIIGIIIGIIVMIFCDIIVQKKFNTNKRFEKNENTLLKTGIIVSIGLESSISNMFARYTRRYINGSTNEKWRNENIKSYFLCSIIRNNNRHRGIFWSNCRFNITRSNINLFKLCSRSYAIYCVRRINTRIKSTISWENDSCRKYDRFYNRNFCYNVVAKKCLKNLQFLLTFNIKNNIIIKNLKSILEKEKKCKKY